jgi:hypothetical protein
VEDGIQNKSEEPFFTEGLPIAAKRKYRARDVTVLKAQAVKM